MISVLPPLGIQVAPKCHLHCATAGCFSLLWQESGTCLPNLLPAGNKFKFSEWCHGSPMVRQWRGQHFSPKKLLSPSLFSPFWDLSKSSVNQTFQRTQIQLLGSFFCEFCCVSLDGGRHRENNNEGTHFPPPFAFVLCNHQEKIFCSEWPFRQHWPCPPLPRSLGWPRGENLGALLLDYGNLLDLDF